MKKYFDDYEYIEVPKKNGKGTKRQMVYIGETYTWDLPLKEQKKQCLWFTLISVLCGGIHLFGAVQALPSNSTSVVGVPAALALISIFVMLFGSVNGFTVKGAMEKSKYRGTALYRRYGALFTAVIMAYSLAALLVYIGKNQRAVPVTGELLLAVEYGGVLALSMGMYFMEKKNRYEVGRSKRDENKEIARRSRL